MRTTGDLGGPIALAGYMQRDLVEQRRWISKQEYLDGLALALKKAPEPIVILIAGAAGIATTNLR